MSIHLRSYPGRRDTRERFTKDNDTQNNLVYNPSMGQPTTNTVIMLTAQSILVRTDIILVYIHSIVVELLNRAGPQASLITTSRGVSTVVIGG